ncbi:galactan 5-O-arabinofuranosyltransferase [Halopolyspora algeriensis]|uniref:Galactan 5-O-arabinofuranosyltransferase n=1 Tax=Halopolyspora algeriensis TaxID=1500506 RepID=A0A368VUY3_9ACTN|nr:arabinofuranosyltransferase [Halopolyspora algeriensis]RCW43253.1 galactan 5-O-arabinofuranosyltransferase [Halopolyspora algeriensis]TQM56312.1 galactan 5-O-arabinofuranosyltransferase [Halopolyspora algeriensis]
MAGILPRPQLTGPSPTDEPHHDSPARLSLRSTVLELLLGSAVAAVLSLALQFVIARIGIGEPSYAPEALAAVGSAVVLALLFVSLAFGHSRSPRILRLVGAWMALAAFNTLAMALPLQSTRFYFGGSSTDNAFRMQYLSRMASSPALADMNYADIAPYYPGGWFWLGGRFADLIGWEGWAAYKPYALAWIAVTSVVAFTLWSVLVRRRLALLAALATSLAGMLHGVMEPYAWPSAAWLPPVAVLTWRALRREQAAPRTLFGIGCFVGFAAITYTLHFAFSVLLIVTMAVIIGISRVHEGDSAGATAKRLFLRLLPIGVLSGAISLIVWAPFLLSGGLLHSSAAQNYLPESSAFLPVPMTEPNPFGVLCLAGLVWLLLRCRHNHIAAALLTVVLSVYCWFALSTLALIVETTLLAFRLNVILSTTLAAAGALGLLELIGYLRTVLDTRHAFRITAVACTFGLLGAITITQAAIGTALASPIEDAYEDYYPTGTNAKGQQDPDEPGAWLDELTTAVGDLTGRRPQENILLTTNYSILSFEPYWGFQQETPHYANPLAHYPARAAEIREWAGADSTRELLRMLDRSEFKPPNVFILRHEPKQDDQDTAADGDGSNRPLGEGKLALTLKADAFPQQPNVRNYTVHFDAAVFDSPAFAQREVGPYTVIALR